MLEKDLEEQRRRRERSEEQAATLRLENAWLDERVKAAEWRAGEIKAQLESLQAKLGLSA